MNRVENRLNGADTLTVSERSPSPIDASETRKTQIDKLFRFPNAVERDPIVERWMQEHSDELGALASHWFNVIRGSGDDVRELLHDGRPTACVGDAAFAYVDAFKAHVNVGFFRGAELPDPTEMLEGTGKLMRHVKLRPERDIDGAALFGLIEAAYAHMSRLSGREDE